MSHKTGIQWTDVTWNIARGCTKVDEDCKFCYMYRDSFDGSRYDPLQIVRTKTVFDPPLRIKEPSRIFTCSLTDFFHEAIDSYRNEAWDIIRKCPQHTFQILTKRPERIAQCLPEDWGEGWDNVWLGTSAGSQKGVNERIPYLLMVPAKTTFLSLEPLHGPIDLTKIVCNDAQVFKFMGLDVEKNELVPLPATTFTDFNCLGESNEMLPYTVDWVIVGGESGNDNGKYRYRPCEIAWIEKIVNDCMAAKIPVFVKQMGTHLSKVLNMSDRHGGDIDEFPPYLQVRQFPDANGFMPYSEAIERGLITAPTPEGSEPIKTEEGRKYLWTLCFGGKNGDEVFNICSVAMKALGEIGQYTKSEIDELRKIKASIPEPDFSYGNPFEKQDRLIGYSQTIRAKLNQAPNDERSVATVPASE